MSVSEPLGLSSQEAIRRLEQYGPNTLPQERPSYWLAFLAKFWGPIPWMLEATIGLELFLGRPFQAAIVGVLLVFNSIISFVQEGRAQNALALLKRRLAPQARVRRDGVWQTLAAESLVPGDWVRVRLGDVLPADLELGQGQVLVDQSALTGESVPVEAGPGAQVWAGTVLRRGEAEGMVKATAAQTRFGQTAALVKEAHSQGHLERTILSVVKVLLLMVGVLVLTIVLYALWRGLPLGEVLSFCLILLVASVPAALPATFTLATALGALELAQRGVLVTRLSAIEEAAAMDVLCSDKTGTLTQNQLSVSKVVALRPFTEDEVLRFGALASEAATQDPLDLAILEAARARGLTDLEALSFVPFDPASKRSEATVRSGDGVLRVMKGAPQTLAALTHSPEPRAELEALATEGNRVLAVAVGKAQAPPRLAGLIGLADPPRPDSAALVQRLQNLGVRVVMVTGDGVATARSVATQIGLNSKVCTLDQMAADCSVLAGVYPEDKFQLIQTFQQAGHVVGMTGDGVNDAPALKQAEVGIAVASATDVAKAAASVVLTDPGLTNVLAAVEEGRRIYQRMLTYTLNKIIKTFQIGFFLGLGFLLTGVFVTTPQLVLLLLFANDFVTMSIASDHVGFSPTPDRWAVNRLTQAALVLAGCWLLFAFGIFYLGRDWLALPLGQLQSLIFLMLVFSGQATVYLVRERGHFWGSRPGKWLILSSLADLLGVSLLAGLGILMSPLNPTLIAGLLGVTLLYALVLDWIKVGLFHRLKLA
ncbi:MAG: plasma-membrane proton-efflux P-type ATPase [Thermaceae bacterium]|nr:plasma-membrane proton-efflux P-type ATPase [Thermaceae bacterium]